jgi:CRP/FNR family cyclic AMP-dependent transcriptional regulator
MGYETLLAKQALFAGCSLAQLTELARKLQPRSYHEGDVIFYMGDPGTGLYLVTRGTVKVSLESADGQETMVALILPGDLFGELAVLDGEPRSATAIAMEPVEALFLRREDFVDFIEHTPGMAMRVIGMLCRRLRQTDELLGDLVFYNVSGRVAKKLLELARTHGVHANGGVAIRLPLTQQELANLVGSSRESVNKVMRYFRERRYVSIDRRYITLHQPEQLEALVAL